MSILERVLSTKQTDEIEHFSPSELLAALFRALSNKEQDIVKSRFGLAGGELATLEDIGKRYKVTRERIRQIEKSAIRTLRTDTQYGNNLETASSLVTTMLEAHGGAMEQEAMLRELLSTSAQSEAERRATLFLLRELLTDRVVPMGKTDGFRDGWKLKMTPLSLLQEIDENLVRLFTTIGKTASYEDIRAAVAGDTFFVEHTDAMADDRLLAALERSPHISRNPFGDWGLVGWGAIVPHRMNEKIALVLKKHGKPLHFQEITQRINDAAFDKRKAYAPTVHNELILNDEYVLVGRGIYALKEWGYRPGVVADVVESILKANDKPMARDELVERVLEQRMVKKNTITLALSDGARFEKLPDGRYRLRGTPLTNTESTTDQHEPRH